MDATRPGQWSGGNDRRRRGRELKRGIGERGQCGVECLGHFQSVGVENGNFRHASLRCRDADSQIRVKLHVDAPMESNRIEASDNLGLQQCNGKRCRRRKFEGDHTIDR